MGWAELESALAAGVVRKNDHFGHGGFRIVTKKVEWARLSASKIRWPICDALDAIREILWVWETERD